MKKTHKVRSIFDSEFSENVFAFKIISWILSLLFIQLPHLPHICSRIFLCYVSLHFKMTYQLNEPIFILCLSWVPSSLYNVQFSKLFYCTYNWAVLMTMGVALPSKVHSSKASSNFERKPEEVFGENYIPYNRRKMALNTFYQLVIQYNLFQK